MSYAVAASMNSVSKYRAVRIIEITHICSIKNDCSGRRWLTGVMRRDRELPAHSRGYAQQFFRGLVVRLRGSAQAPQLRRVPGETN